MTALPCGKEACPEHGDLCAFHGDEDGLCPWCHCSWERIIDTDWHSCERVDVWPPGQRKTRPGIAKVRRLAAARLSRADRGVFCPHVGLSATA